MAEGRFAEVDDLERWPYSTNFHSDLYAVVRQSVEELPQEKGAALVEHLPEWGGVLKRLRDLTASLPALQAGKLDEWDCSHQWFGLESARSALANYHLPATIGTARYALWSISPKNVRPPLPPAWPTRGALVTSFFLGPASGFRHDELPEDWYPGEVVFNVEGSSRWVTAKIWQQVGQVVENHARWWQGRKLFDLLPPPNLRRANTGSAPRDTDWRGDVLDVLSGLIDEDEAVRREMVREAEEHTKPATQLGPLVLREVRKRVAERIRREKQKSRHV